MGQNVNLQTEDFCPDIYANLSDTPETCFVHELGRLMCLRRWHSLIGCVKDIAKDVRQIRNNSPLNDADRYSVWVSLATINFLVDRTLRRLDPELFHPSSEESEDNETDWPDVAMQLELYEVLWSEFTPDDLEALRIDLCPIAVVADGRASWIQAEVERAEQVADARWRAEQQAN